LYFLQQQGLKITTATNISLGCLSVSAIVFLLGGYVMERVGRRVLFVYFQYVVVFSHALDGPINVGSHSHQFGLGTVKTVCYISP
jgi:hypothetical protein